MRITVARNKIFGIVISTGLLFLSNGCVLSDEKNSFPCFDGWTVESTIDGRDASAIYEPTEEFFTALEKQFLVDRAEVVCVHILKKQNKFIIIERDRDTLVIKKVDYKYYFVERGFLA